MRVVAFFYSDCRFLFVGNFYLVTPNLWQISRVAVDWLSV